MTDKILVSRSEIIYMLRNIINIDKPELAAYLVNVNELHALLDKAAISQAEPVAWVDLETSQHFNKVSKDFVGTFLYGEDSDYTIPLYTSPPADKQDAEIGKLVRSKLISGNDVPVSRCYINASEVEAIDAEIQKGER